MIRALLLLLALAATPAFAQVISPAPDKVAVTLYRDPERAVGTPMALDELGSFALVVETRTVDLPPGVATVRFEGVASGIIPQSAILFGTQVREKNRDAALLSQKGLIDAFTGQRVLLRRTDPATGRTAIEPATIRSGTSGTVLQTARGVEAVYCSGLSQTVLFSGVPATLSARPVLSMTTRDQPGGRVMVTLAYLAANFDWDATYVGTLSPGATELELFAWLTMASGDETSFVDATAAAVAGKVNRSEDTRDGEAGRIRDEAESFRPDWNCWPAGTTSDLPGPPLPPPPPPPVPMAMMLEVSDIVVTGARRVALKAAVPIAVTAVSESLGDLKLYRIPVPVTVAARSQKQVAFLQKPRIKGRLLYRSRVNGSSAGDPQLLFRFRNSKRDGAGDPLPAGKVAMFQPFGGERMLVGEGDLPDKAADEEVDIVFGEAANVSVETDGDPRDDDAEDVVLTVRNANPHPIAFEAEFRTGDYRLDRTSARLVERPGKRVWSVRVPANGTSVLRYRTRDTG